MSFCSSCGASLTSSDKFCTQCGTKVGSIPPPNESKRGQDSSKESGSFFGADIPIVESAKGKLKNLYQRSRGRNYEREGQINENMKMRRFKLQSYHMDDLVQEFQNWMDWKNFNHQRLRTENGDLLIQLQKKGEWKHYLGMGTALNVLFTNEHDVLILQVGAGKWMDKALAVGVGAIFLWPFAVTGAFGAIEQATIPKAVFNFVEEYCDEMHFRDGA